jgi:hypothetical protein
MASEDGVSVGSITRRNLVAATTLVVAALGSRSAHAREHEHHHGQNGGGSHCYLRGTAILTPSGEREIGELRIGDPVVTYSGAPKPIKWIGRRRLQRDDGDWPLDLIPVKLMRSALDDDVPHRELLLSPNHAIYVDGQLIPAGALVNKRTITSCREAHKVIEYLHVELFEPDVIFTEGAPTETFLPFRNRRMFDNSQEYERLYGAEQTAIDAQIAPRVEAMSKRFQLRSRLRSSVSPWWDIRTQFDITRDRIECRADFLAAA